MGISQIIKEVIVLNINGLISADEIRKEEFNAQILDVNDISQFLAYYALLLHTAVEYLFISKEQTDKISNSILETFYKRFEGTPIAMSNNMYVLTAYLKTMDNYEQLSILSKVTDVDKAEKLFDKVYQWLLEKIKRMEDDLNSFVEDVRGLKEIEFMNSWKEIHTKVQELKTYSSLDAKVSFKIAHQSFLETASYICTNSDVSYLNYFERISKWIENFKIEIQILNKLEVKEILKNLRFHDRIEYNLLIEKNKKERDFNERKIKENLFILKDYYSKKLEEAEKAEMLYQERLDALEEEDKAFFKTKHPEITNEDEFLDAFYEWQAELPDEHFEIDLPCVDVEEIKKEYLRKRKKLQRELELLENIEEENEFYEPFSLLDISFLDGIIKIKSILILAQYTEITIPKNLKEIKDSIMRIDIKTAVQILLSDADTKEKFDDEEIQYLKRL